MLLQLPDYHDIIEHPMDFGTVRKKLDGGLYTNLEQFEVGCNYVFFASKWLLSRSLYDGLYIYLYIFYSVSVYNVCADFRSLIEE